MSDTVASVSRLAEMADLTLDAYRTLAQAMGAILATATPEQRDIIMAAYEESTIILNLATSPDGDGGA